MMSSVDIKGNSSVRMNGQDRLPPFVLVTPAHNEEALIKKTIESVISQTILPMRWVIVDDRNTHLYRRAPRLEQNVLARRVAPRALRIPTPTCAVSPRS